MKKMNLSVLFWALAGFSLTLAGLSFTGLSPQMLVLSHVACVLVLSTLYWIKSHKQNNDAETQNDSKQDEINSLRERTRNTMESLLGSVQAVMANSERSTSDIENLNNLVQTTSENAKQAAMLSHQSRTTVESSVKAISELYSSMNEVSQSSKKITEILSMIEDIAFQTNLLALNAAVEAARAGEQGKGFAVVAEAVRNLAQKSSSAAKDISSLIQETTMNIKKGCDQAQNSQQLLNSILSGSLKVSDINNEISLSSQEQATNTQNLRALLSELVMSQQDIIKQIQEGTTGTPVVAATPVKKFERVVKETTSTPVAEPVAIKPKNKFTSRPAVNTKSKAEKAAAPVIALRSEKAKPSKQVTLKKPVDAKLAEPTPTQVVTDVKAETAAEPAKAAPKKIVLEPSLTSKPKTSKTPQELIPFDEDEDRLKLTKASDF
ncbi:MAG: hypothetical protein JNM24_17345 [Bdellovibrionaceae bacterium]|nr:hypothetical protein [Pseudobdellovibrionaceae bacterium]